MGWNYSSCGDLHPTPSLGEMRKYILHVHVVSINAFLQLWMWVSVSCCHKSQGWEWRDRPGPLASHPFYVYSEEFPLYFLAVSIVYTKPITDVNQYLILMLLFKPLVCFMRASADTSAGISWLSALLCTKWKNNNYLFYFPASCIFNQRLQANVSGLVLKKSRSEYLALTPSCAFFLHIYAMTTPVYILGLR